MLIDLKAPRVLSIEDRGRSFVYTLNPITAALWAAYFGGVISQSEVIDKNRVDRFDNATATCELLRSVIVDVSGFSVRNDQPVTAQEGWLNKLPLNHLITLGGVVRNVTRGRLPDDEIFLGEEQVVLDAAWGTPAFGTVQRKGLVHRFNSPTIEQQRRYSRESSRSMVVGGSRTGTTRWLGAQKALMELYDEMVAGVEGYAADGVELGTDVERIRAVMDGYHKVVAAEALFTPVTVAEKEEEIA